MTVTGVFFSSFFCVFSIAQLKIWTHEDGFVRKRGVLQLNSSGDSFVVEVDDTEFQMVARSEDQTYNAQKFT